MLIGGWGERSIGLLDLAAARTGAALDRVGSLGVMGATGATEGRWRCWMSGCLTNADVLCKRFGAPGPVDLNASIARAHNQIGPPACDLLRGTFILVAADPERDITLVSRDHLGGRPLVYACVGSGALFAEHERDILELLPKTPTANRLALVQWIIRGSTPAGLTLYEGIHRVPPGHRLVISPEGVEVEHYWLPRYEGVAAGSRHTLGERMRGAAFAAVERAAADARRPALRLSGGLDSACVAAGLAAQRESASRALALAAVFPTHPETDERELIEATARHTGLSVELVPFDDRASILAPALRHVARWRLPPASPNLLVMEPVMALARELGVDVMLDGEGGDELFGLAPYLIADRLRMGRLISAWTLTGLIPEMGDCPDPRIRLRALRLFGASPLLPPAARRWRRRRGAQPSEKSLLEHADALALNELDGRGSWEKLDGPLWWRALADQLINEGETLGVSAHMRRDSLDAGIDRRHPFLYDLELVRIVLSTPPELQFDPLRDRSLLRDALSGHIPEQVRTRHAKSFFTQLLPAGLALDGDLFAERLAHPDAPIRAYVNGRTLDRLVGLRATWGDPRTARLVWQVGLADTWLRAGEAPGSIDALSEQLAQQRRTRYGPA